MSCLFSKLKDSLILVSQVIGFSSWMRRARWRRFANFWLGINFNLKRANKLL
jgi:hypothetical protein